MRILLLIPSMVGMGGTEKMVEALTRLLSDAGHTVFLASFDPSWSNNLAIKSNSTFALGPVPELPLPLRSLAYVWSAWRLAKLKQRIRIDLTISNLWRADLVSQLSRGTDLKVALCHINVIGNPSNRLMLRLLPLVATVYKRFDKVIAVSEPLASELQHLYRLSPSRVGFINNFVYPALTTSSRTNDDHKRFVWCGRMVKEKNVAGLLHVWSHFCKINRGVQLLLLGDGPLYAELRGLASSLGLRHGEPDDGPDLQVIFVGKVSNPADYMAQARALILTSISEGIPVVILEALSLGIPVIAADSKPGGVRSAILGSGECNPTMTSVELTPCGALLPIPHDKSNRSISLWCEALNTAATDDLIWRNWCQGSFDRYQIFSPAHAGRMWNRMLTSLLKK